MDSAIRARLQHIKRKDNGNSELLTVTDLAVVVIVYVGLFNFKNKSVFYIQIISTQCCYRFFGDFDWSVGKIKLFLHFDKNPCV